MQGINCVKGEIHNVLTVLRLNPPRDANGSHSSSLLSSSSSSPSSSTHSSSYSHYYSSDNRYGTEDNSLIRQLKDLYELLSLHSSLSELDTSSFLSPFLSVVSSHTTDIFTTAAALHSVHKFLVYGLINSSSSAVARGLIDTVDAVTHCNFDVRDREDAEVVSMKIIEILMECLRCSAGEQLNDDAVVDMVEECLAVRSRTPGASKLLRRYAENALMQMVLVLFARISEEGRGVRDVRVTNSRHANGGRRKGRRSIPSPSDEDEERRRRDAAASPDLVNSGYDSSTSTRSLSPPRPLSSPARSSHSLSSPSASSSSSASALVPYGVPALERVFRLLVELINPTASGSAEEKEADRVLGLRLIRTVLETAGARIGAYPALVSVIQDRLCKNLLQTSQTKNLFVLTLTLRIVFDLFSTVKQHLKVQLEVFFVSIHLRIADSPTSSFEQKELVMESLVEFCKEPSLIVGLYRNYDCEVGSTDLFTDLCRFLSQQGVSESRLSSLALEAMVAVLQSIAKRFCTDLHVAPAQPQPSSSLSAPVAGDASAPSSTTSLSSSSPPPYGLHGSSSSSSSYDSDDEASSLIMNPEEESAILRSKAEKKKLLLAAERFNVEGRASFKFLQSLGILPTPVTPDSLVRFFRSTPSLDRRKIGEFLGGHEPLQLSVLDKFVESFSFKDVRPSGAAAPQQPGQGSAHEVSMDDALRTFLDCFLLPGEAQQIARIIEKFSAAFFRHCPGPLATADAAYVLAYSVIMLNTDAHNPQVQKKMTKDEFIRNLRGINDGKDLPAAYLSSLFDSITSHEIRMTGDQLVGDEEAGADGFSARKWHSVLSKASGLFQTSAPRIHGRDMFSLVWTSAVSMFAAYLENRELHSHGSSSSAPEHKLLQKVQQGFYAFGRICSVYALNDCFNSLIITLAKSLATFMAEALNDPAGFSPAAAFGRDRRAQMVATTLFKLVSEYGEAHLLEGWTNVLHAVLWLRQLDLLPQALLEVEDFRDAQGGPLDSLRRAPRQSINSAGGLQGGGYSKLSYLVSFFLSEDEGPARSASASAAADAQWAQEGRDVIASCSVESLFVSSKFFRPASLSCLLRSLLQVSSFATQPSSLLSLFSPVVLHEEAAVFCLERFSEVIERNQTRLSDPALKLWSTLYDHFFSAITHAPPEPTYYIERLVVNLLRFSVRLLHTSDPSVTSHCIQLLSLLLALSPSTLHVLASRIVAGLQIFLQTQGEALKDRKSWEIIGRLLLTFRGESQQGLASTAFATFMLCLDNFVTLDTFPVFLAFLYQWTSPVERRAKSPHAAAVNGVDGRAAVSPRLVLDGALKLHQKIATPAVEAGLSLLGEGSSAREKARVDLWLSSVQQLCLSCKDGRADVRRYAMECLHSVLLANDSVDMHNPLAWRIALEKLLLPMMEAVAHFTADLSRPLPRSPSRDPAAVDAERSERSSSPSPSAEAPFELQLRASSLLFHTFLHHVDTLLLTPDFSIFWLKLLGSIQSRLHLSGASSPLQQHFVESLKNTLLVMRASGVFDEVHERTGQDLYELTMGVIDTFHPEWKVELTQCMWEGRTEDDRARESEREGDRARLREVGAAIASSTPIKDALRSASDAAEELASPLSVSSFLSGQAHAPRQPLLQQQRVHHGYGNANGGVEQLKQRDSTPPALNGTASSQPSAAAQPAEPLHMHSALSHQHSSAGLNAAARPAAGQYDHPQGGNRSALPLTQSHPQFRGPPLSTATNSQPVRPAPYQPHPRAAPSQAHSVPALVAPAVLRKVPTAAVLPSPMANGIQHGAPPVVIRFPPRAPFVASVNGAHSAVSSSASLPSAFLSPPTPGTVRPLPGYTPVPRPVSGQPMRGAVAPAPRFSPMSPGALAGAAPWQPPPSHPTP